MDPSQAPRHAVTTFPQPCPIEILKEIYLQCDDATTLFKMDKCYNLLHEFEELKTHLIQVCCINPGLRQHATNRAHYDFRRLLKQDWLTAGYLLSAAWSWLVPTTMNELDKVLSKYNVDAKQRRTVEDFALKILNEQKKQPRYPSWPGPPTHKLDFETPNSSAILALDVNYTSVQFWLRFPDVDSYSKTTVIAFPGPIINLQVLPPKLLRGPWTQRDGDLLNFVLAHLRRSKTHWSGLTKSLRTDTALGLQRAISERNLPALSLLGDNMRALFSVSEVHERLNHIDRPLSLAQNRFVDRRPWTRMRVPWAIHHACWADDTMWSERLVRELDDWVLDLDSMDAREVFDRQAVAIGRGILMRGGLGAEELARGIAKVIWLGGRGREMEVYWGWGGVDCVERLGMSWAEAGRMMQMKTFTVGL